MKEIIYEKVGARLKYARELRDISLEKAGEAVGVHKSTVLRWERGNTEKFKIPVLETLANLYNVNPAWLMGYDVPMEKTPPTTLKNDFRYATQSGINTDGLDIDEMEERKRFVEFIRNKKKSKNK